MNTAIISERIRQGRKARGLTQSELAENLKLSEMTVRRWEGDKSSPRIEELNKLAKVFNVPVSYFTDDDGSDLVSTITKGEQSSEQKQNMAVITLENGRKIEAPATPEGYEFLKELFAMSLSGQTSAVSIA